MGLFEQPQTLLSDVRFPSLWVTAWCPVYAKPLVCLEGDSRIQADVYTISGVGYGTGSYQGDMKPALNVCLYHLSIILYHYIHFSNLYKLSLHTIKVFVCNSLLLPLIVTELRYTTHCFFLFSSDTVWCQIFCEFTA